MVLVLCWRQQLQLRLPWRRYTRPGWVRYQHAWQNEATSMLHSVEIISADREHTWANPSNTQRWWWLPSSEKVARDCVASSEWLQASRAIGQEICCTAYLASSMAWIHLWVGTLLLSKHTWRPLRVLPAAAVAGHCSLAWPMVPWCKGCSSLVEPFGRSLHGASWWWRGHQGTQETFCELLNTFWRTLGSVDP